MGDETEHGLSRFRWRVMRRELPARYMTTMRYVTCSLCIPAVCSSHAGFREYLLVKNGSGTDGGQAGNSLLWLIEWRLVLC
ncbi:MAG: hypothetical protein LBU84_00560 [Prevotella sp.]|nr:hypothetical protein [Prevotella sp.]